MVIGIYSSMGVIIQNRARPVDSKAQFLPKCITGRALKIGNETLKDLIKITKETIEDIFQLFRTRILIKDRTFRTITAHGDIYGSYS